MFKIEELRGEQIAKVFPLVKELRTHLDLEAYLRLVKEAQIRDDYRLVGITRDEFCYGVMGYRILYDLTHGKHLYVDDLVITKDMRSQGLGHLLLDHARKVAMEEGCTGMRLCTGIENEDARRFYERKGWEARALAYKMRL